MSVLASKVKALVPKTRFARSVSVLAGGTAAGQAVVVLASPLLTRLYTPEDFGLFAVFAALLGILGVIASLRYQLAIPLPESDEKAARVAVLSLLVVLGMTLASAVIVVLFGKPLAHALNTPALAQYFWLLPPGLFLLGVYQVLNYWAIRTRAFSAIARTKLTQSAGMTAVQLGAFALGPVALLLGRIVGQAAGALTLLKISVLPCREAFADVQFHEVVQAANRYRRFPIYSTWGGVFNTAGTQLPPLLFAALFSPAVAGIYLLAARVLGMPMQLLGKAIADVFFSSAADARRTGALGNLVCRIHGKLAHVAMPPVLILALLGPELFEWVFGAAWRDAGVFAQWMAPMVYATFVTSPISTLTSVLEKQVHAVVFQVGLLSMRATGLLVGALHDSILLAVVLFSLGTFLAKSGFLLWAYRATGNNVYHVFSETMMAFIWGALLVSPVALVLLAGESLWLLVGGLLTSIILLGLRYTHLFRATA